MLFSKRINHEVNILFNPSNVFQN